MIQDLEQIEYRRGMLDKGTKTEEPTRESMARGQDWHRRAQDCQ